MTAKYFLRQLLKPIAFHLGVSPRQICVRAYARKRAVNKTYQKWLEQHEHRWIASHWGHYQETDPFEFAHLSSQLFEITETLRRRIGPVKAFSVLDAGASDGMYLQLIGAHNAIGVNFLPKCVQRIKADGFDSLQCDIEKMPFKDKQFDIVLCCETLEHVPNPIQALNELVRVCNGRVHMTIPWLPRTRLNAKPNGWPETESHIFEFSPEDFERIVTFSHARIVYRESIQVFPRQTNPLTNAILKRYIFPNHFPRLQYYELEAIS